MRAPFTMSALVLLAITWVANQFPLWGADDGGSVANDWMVFYMLAAAPFLIAGVVLLWKKRVDLGTGALVLAVGMYGNAFMMELIKMYSFTGDEYTLYAAIQTLLAFGMVGLLVLLQRPDLEAREPAASTGE